MSYKKQLHIAGSLGITFDTAIKEAIDNCMDAIYRKMERDSIKKGKIRIKLFENLQKIAVFDNGIGQTEESLLSSIELGSDSHNDQKTFGTFGLGNLLWSCAAGRSTTYTSLMGTTTIHKIIVDKVLIKSADPIVEVVGFKELILLQNEGISLSSIRNGSGTVVVFDNITVDKLTKQPNVWVKEFTYNLSKTYNRMFNHDTNRDGLQITFVIDDATSKKFKSKKLFPIDPLRQYIIRQKGGAKPLMDIEKKNLRKYEFHKNNFSNGKITAIIKACAADLAIDKILLPFKVTGLSEVEIFVSELISSGGQDSASKDFNRDTRGARVYRNDRLIMEAHKSNGAASFGLSNTSEANHFRFEINYYDCERIPTGLDDRFDLSAMKTSITLNSKDENGLFDLLRPFESMASRRSKNLAENNTAKNANHDKATLLIADAQDELSQLENQRKERRNGGKRKPSTKPATPPNNDDSKHQRENLDETQPMDQDDAIKRLLSYNNMVSFDNEQFANDLILFKVERKITGKLVVKVNYTNAFNVIVEKQHGHIADMIYYPFAKRMQALIDENTLDSNIEVKALNSLLEFMSIELNAISDKYIAESGKKSL